MHEPGHIPVLEREAHAPEVHQRVNHQQLVVRPPQRPQRLHHLVVALHIVDAADEAQAHRPAMGRVPPAGAGPADPVGVDVGALGIHPLATMMSRQKALGVSTGRRR